MKEGKMKEGNGGGRGKGAAEGISGGAEIFGGRAAAMAAAFRGRREGGAGAKILRGGSRTLPLLWRYQP